MPHFEIPQTWRAIANSDRSCGPCYACCVWLGIEELHKYTGQTCRHLSGGTDPTKRCSIYSKRPHACSTYQCLWRAGLGPDNMRPYESGILITSYESERDPPGSVAFTVNIFDEAKALGHIEEILGELLALPKAVEVRLVYIHRRSMMLFRHGQVYRCRLMPPDGYESLVFEAFEPSVGRYLVKELHHDRPREVHESSSAVPSPASTVDS